MTVILDVILENLENLTLYGVTVIVDVIEDVNLENLGNLTLHDCDCGCD